MKTPYRYGALLAAIALARVSVLAQVPGPERVPVTDPDRLERMGFDRDARNVFVWSKADMGGASASPRAAAPAPESLGDVGGLYHRAGASAFRPSVRNSPPSFETSPGRAATRTPAPTTRSTRGPSCSFRCPTAPD